MLDLALLAGAVLLLFRGQRQAPLTTASVPVAPAPAVQQEPTAFPPVKVSIGLASGAMRAVLSDATAMPRPAPRAIGSVLPRHTAPDPAPRPRQENILAHIERGYIQ